MNYWLKLYDDNLIKFTMDSEVGEGFKSTILSVNTDKRDLLPLELIASADNEKAHEGIENSRLTKWLEGRVIPKSREFVEEILKLYGLSTNNIKGIIDICKGLSLNDSYWVVPENFQGKFADCNLYENKFSEVLALVAYTGAGGGDKTPFTTSPEYTTGGMLRKAWRNIDGKIVLFKGGTSGAANAGLEPYSEYYACQIARAMGLHTVMYGLEEWKGILASTCELFTDINTSFIPIGRLVKEGKYKGVNEWFKKFDAEHGTNLNDSFLSMLAFDGVVYNEDRHFGNFGILRDNHSGKITDCAPIFDHGISLFNYAMSHDLENLEEYRKTRFSSINEPFDDIVRVFCGKKQKEQLRKLKGFKFILHNKYNWEPERLKIIEAFIQKRVEELLGIISG